MSYPRYPTMRNSGVEWLGEVPHEWQQRRMRFVCEINPSKAELSLLPEDTTVSFVAMEKVGTDGQLLLDTTRLLESVLQGFTYFKDGDVIVAKITPCFENGKGAFCNELVNGIGFGSTEFHVLRPYRDYAPQFIYYVTYSYPFRSIGAALMQGSAGQKRVPDEFVKDFTIAWPPLAEQRRVAAFLDAKTVELDTLVALKERQVALLLLQRQALISHAVTKGLDPNAPMADSGVEWLGEVPAGWEITRVKFLARSIQTGPFGSQLYATDYVEGGTPVINPSNIQNSRIVPDYQISVDVDTITRLSRHVLMKGDIVCARRGELGRCGLVTKREQGWLCGTGSLRVRPNTSKSFPAYLGSFLSLSSVKEWLVVESVGSTMNNLNTDILANLPIMCPPLSEQRAIVAYLDRETSQIDTLVATIRAQIERLRVYRQALISAAVTGKIDVREIKLGAEAEES